MNSTIKLPRLLALGLLCLALVVTSRCRANLDPPAPDGVTVQEDVVFGVSLLEDGTRLERVMNVYTLAEQVTSPRPALVFLHGNPGDRPYPGDRQKRYREYTDHFAKRGYVCFVPAWDLRQGHAAGFEIVRMAMLHIRRESARYGIDPERVGAVGHSYGSRHACTLGTADFLKPEARANAVVMLAGGMSYPGDCDENDAPTLLVYGTADEWFPQAAGIRESLQRGNVPHAYIEVPDGPHGIPSDTVVAHGQTLLAAMDAFLANVLRVGQPMPLYFVSAHHMGPGGVALGETPGYGLYPPGHSLQIRAIPESGARLDAWKAPEGLTGLSPTLTVEGYLQVRVSFVRD